MKKIYKIPIRMLSISHRNWEAASFLPKPDYGPVEVQHSALLNGTGVSVTKAFGAQIGACTIMYQAGSRYESDENIGVNHFLRATSCASGCAFSGITKMRYLMQKGASITCTSDRQSIAYTLRCPVSIFSEMKCFLLDTVLRCRFYQWEIDDLKPLIRDDLHRIHPEQRVIDLAQKACWSGPLSNSMYCTPGRIDSMTGEALCKYAHYNFKTDHCTVASTGVPFEETMKLAESIEPKRIRPNARDTWVSRPRGGFELYDLGPNSDTWICVVVPGCGTCDSTHLIRHAIIAHACGISNVDGSRALDCTPQRPLGILNDNDVHTSIRAFNISYYETGVFGIIARTPAASAWKTATAAAKFLSNIGGLDDTQIEIGKKRLKVNLALHDDDCVKVSEGLALQAANGAQLDNAKTIMTMIDSISNQDVRAVAAGLSVKIKCDQLALAVVGDIGQVPNEKELICPK